MRTLGSDWAMAKIPRDAAGCRTLSACDRSSYSEPRAALAFRYPARRSLPELALGCPAWHLRCETGPWRGGAAPGRSSYPPHPPALRGRGGGRAVAGLAKGGGAAIAAVRDAVADALIRVISRRGVAHKMG